MNEELGKIALAGLLHDIGKLGQRAGEGSARGKDHASVGDKFVTTYVPTPWAEALAPVGWHHGDPEGRGHELYRVQVVMVADRLSAGEREHRDEEGKGGLTPMLSPFSRLASAASTAWLPLEPLELKPDHLFPRPHPPDPQRTREDYATLWHGLCREAQTLRNLHEIAPNLETYILSMLDLLLRYTWSVPSAYYYDVPDVSLYDHLRATAALATCLFVAFQDRPEELRRLAAELRGQEVEKWPSEPVVAGLVEGDLSGIQDFLYAIKHPKGAASVLRARSFYLQMLPEVLARWILRELGLPPTNLLYCGGGRFRLLVPPQDLAQLEGLSAEINRILLLAHHGRIYLALAGVALTPAHFASAPVRRTDEGRWEAERGLRKAENELHKLLEYRKHRRFLELTASDLAGLFQPYGEGGATCQICGQPGPLTLDEEEVRWCPTCASFRELGRDLRHARFLRLTWEQPQPLPDRPSWQDVLAHFGFRLEVYAELPPPSPKPSILYRLTDKPVPARAAQEAVARKFLVNVVPIWRKHERAPKEDPEYAPQPGEIKHFGVLAHQAQGAPYLGILRMDMDNLGWLIRDGFVEQRNGEGLDRGTFSRKQSLSTLLSVFFEGYVGEILRGFFQAEESERIYAVYSGGDDLFFVGSWDAVVALALRIREEFERFTARPDLGISAALLLVGEKHPLYRAAQEAGERLEEAKETVLEGEKPQDGTSKKRKDAVHFLGQVVRWSTFREVKEWKERLEKAVRADEAARRLLFALQEVWESYEREKGKRGPWGPWMWRAAYWLARQEELAKRANQDPSVFVALREKLSGEQFCQNIPVLALAARWAELSTRQKGR